jgi:hypothetical protein
MFNFVAVFAIKWGFRKVGEINNAGSTELVSQE